MGESQQANLSLTALQSIEAATLALLQAVRQAAQGISVAHAPAPHGPTLVDAINGFLIAKARANRSDRYVRQLRVSLASLARGREGQPVATLTSDQIEAWLYRSDWQPRTRKGYLMDVRALLAWCARRGVCPVNAALGVDMPVAEPPSVGIHSPDQVRQVLQTAFRLDPDCGRILALRYFAGLRSAEANRLEEAHLSPDFVEVPGFASKTRQRRLVPVAPNLTAWLKRGGRLPLTDANNRLSAVVRAAGVPWPHNVTRHSFCSYHLAAGQNAAKTALEAGHSEAMLFAHYRELVRPEQAKAFWAIRPKLTLSLPLSPSPSAAKTLPKPPGERPAGTVPRSL